uniref:Transcription elongation factor 1 homolog n=1 Tax=Prymnesium polylepis TaxID=72548 RepID=A0A7S4IE92_9EUKA
MAVGKRKRAKPPPKKGKPKVATVFDCPFCGKTDACGVMMDFDHKVGSIACDSCGARHESRIHRLTEPIDVYAEWIDKCEAVNNGGDAAAGVRDNGDDGEPQEDDYDED